MKAHHKFKLSLTRGIAFFLPLLLEIADCQCPTSWRKNPYTGRCLKFYNSEKTWQDARAICKASGADLVKILSSDENQFVADIARGNKRGGFFIGLHKDEFDGIFYWLDDTTQARFTSWAAGEPKSFPNKPSCVETSFQRGYNWTAADCLSVSKFLCERFPICGNNTYGDSCNKSCPAKCEGSNNTCNHINGSCTSGCLAGYRGERCDKVCDNDT
ncbi:hypothetical protein RRG08_023897, partial [Elysia crispata]